LIPLNVLQTDNKAGEKRRGSYWPILLRGGLLALILVLFLRAMDWHEPWITLEPETSAVGPRTEFWLEAGDRDSGLRSIRVSVVQDGQEEVLLTRSFTPTAGLFGSRGSRYPKVEMPVRLDAPALGLRAGKACIVVQVRDLSWRNRFQGRLATLNREVVINLAP
jgi:hypothetical protein